MACPIVPSVGNDLANMDPRILATPVVTRSRMLTPGSRRQVVEYLDAYAEHFGLAPRVDTTATRALREDGEWRVDTNAGTYREPFLVVASGVAGSPFLPDWPGAENFAGDIRHSVEYRNPAA